MLGCLLLDPDRCFPILTREGIGPEHWYDLRLREIYTLLEQMRRAGEGISEATVLMRGEAKELFQAPEARHLQLSLPERTTQETSRFAAGFGNLRYQQGVTYSPIALSLHLRNLISCSPKPIFLGASGCSQ